MTLSKDQIAKGAIAGIAAGLITGAATHNAIAGIAAHAVVGNTVMMATQPKRKAKPKPKAKHKR